MGFLTSWTGRAVVGLLLAAAVGPYFHIGFVLTQKSELGSKTMLGDYLKGLYPYHFPLVVRVFQYAQMARNEHPGVYYEHERPHILKSLQTFSLHPYFQMPYVPNASDWHGLLHERVKNFRRQMDTTGARDFEMEKDRCQMYRFYRKHNLPLLPLHGEWHTLNELLSAVQDGRAFHNTSAWPVFWKACHLTQSSSAATRAMKAPPTPAEVNELTSWLVAKWEQRANDFERVWAADGNAITAGIMPGFLLQAPMRTASTFKVEGRISVGLAELRVEVLWGRAYLALLDGVTVFTRDRMTQDFSSASTFGQKQPVYTRHWFFDEGHDECVFTVAEKAAHVAGVDSVRIDIFLDRARPEACTINENSLSSGMVYWGHEQFMTRLWAEPHVKRLYRLRDTQLGVLEQ